MANEKRRSTRHATFHQPEWAGGFQLEPADFRDLNWFFDQGPTPGEDVDRVRYRRVESALNGRGFWLRCYLSDPHWLTDEEKGIVGDGESPERQAAEPLCNRSLLRPGRKLVRTGNHTTAWRPAPEEDVFIEFEPGELDELDELDPVRFGEQHLQEEYAAYQVGREMNRRRSHGMHVRRDKPWTVVSEAEFLAAVEGSDGVECPNLVLSRWLNDGRAHHATWGGLRIEVADIELLSRARSGKNAGGAATKLSPRYSPKDAAILGEVFGGEAGYEGARQAQYGAYQERAVGRDHTTVDEIATKLWRNSADVRRLLIEHGCAEAAVPRAPIKVEWLLSDAGRAFWQAALSLPAPKSRKAILAWVKKDPDVTDIADIIDENNES